MAKKSKTKQSAYGVEHEHTVLVLQGGGALGAYQAGVYEGMHEQGFAPDWVAGVSIGAINGALIAGNPGDKRVERLREFWDRVSSGLPLVAPAQIDPVRIALNRLSVYDTSPLRETLEELVDFKLINDRKRVRLSVGAVNVHTGNSVYFDNRRQRLAVEHVMASGSLPPGFPPTEIEGDHYWDGGLVSNSPLSYVLKDSPDISALIIQVDLFSARGDLPVNLDQVLERAKDIQYSSKTRFNTMRAKEMEQMRHALGRLLEKLPARLRDDADYKLLAPQCEDKRQITIAHLINRRFSTSTNAKDYEFSRSTVRELWEAGLDDVRRTCAHREWLRARKVADGIRVFDLTR